MLNKIDDKEVLDLIKNADLKDLGKKALEAKQYLHPEKVTTFVVDRNINYTNICNVGCKFCAFKTGKHSKNGYILPYEEIDKKIDELLSIGGTQILFQGGVHPDLKIEYYEDLVEHIHTKYPQINIHGFSAVEIDYIAEISDMSHKEVLTRLNKKGLASMPGAGAEILVDRVRDILSPNKISSQTWLDIHQAAHEIGMKTTATMMFGSVETDEEIVEHLHKIRELQGKTNGFRAFIMWSFQPSHTPLLKEYPDLKKSSPNRYLRLLAASRLYLYNFKNIQSSWVTQGSYIGQLALLYGANDLGSTMMEENVVASTGCSNSMVKEEMLDLIREIGEKPAIRNTAYQILERF
ncbi:MAG: dehypoxanthine futalosine cyclase [Campylobacterales bacterium]|nr:dehypoxanthine futalosine cyclase [Campylobacterales bacterium]